MTNLVLIVSIESGSSLYVSPVVPIFFWFYLLSSSSFFFSNMSDNSFLLISCCWYFDGFCNLSNSSYF